jgi:hypothetical protein
MFCKTKDTVALKLFGHARRDVLELEHVTDIPYDYLAHAIHCDDVWLSFDVVHRYDWVLVAPQLADKWVPVEVFRVPHIDVDFKASRKKMATEARNVGKLLNAICVMLGEASDEHSFF